MPAAALPPATPSTVQVTAPAPGAAAENCCGCPKVNAAIEGDTTTVPLTIVTDDELLVPPAPWQTREKVVGTDRAPVFCVPLAVFTPLQPPDAVQAVALVELQVNTAELPAATVVAVEVSTDVGTTLTVTLAGLLAAPDPPQVNEYVVLIASGALACEPLAGSAPLQPPDALHDVAPVDAHVSVDVMPAATTVGLAVSVAVAATLTVALAGGLVPPGPVQVTT